MQAIVVIALASYMIAILSDPLVVPPNVMDSHLGTEVQAQCPLLGWRKGITEIAGPHGAPGANGSPGYVFATISWDPDGPGGTDPWLVVGGDFDIKGDFHARNVAAWDGERWRPLGAGLTPAAVESLAVYDSGAGPELYAGGSFSSSGTTSCRKFAKWTGTEWIRPYAGGNVFNSQATTAIYAMTVFDDGTGAQLFLGGHALTPSLSGIMRWNGQAFTGTIGYLDSIYDLFVHDDGSGSELFVGGDFISVTPPGASSVPAAHVAKWDGTAWSAVASGVNGPVYAFETFENAKGSLLHVGGEFSSAGGDTAINIAIWDGVSWSGLPAPGVAFPVTSLRSFDDGTSNKLFIGGSPGYCCANGCFRVWDGAQWISGPSFSPNACNGALIWDMINYQNGGENVLVLAGRMVLPSRFHGVGVSAWDGSNWRQIGRGFDGSINHLCVHSDSAGNSIYAGGTMRDANGHAVNGIMRREEETWVGLGAGVSGPTGQEFVSELVSFDDGTGPALYAAGNFKNAGEVVAGGVAKWNGAEWLDMDGGISNTSSPSGYSVAVHDDGHGSALYLSGAFASIGGISANCVAKWNGTSWSRLGSGMSSTTNTPPAVFQLLAHNDGQGSALYARGEFNRAGSANVNGFARWRNAAWESVGIGPPGTVEQMFLFDNGNTSELHVVGKFDPPTGPIVSYVAVWDGLIWSPAQAQGSWSVRDVTVFDDGCGPAVYASGSFFFDPPGPVGGTYEFGIAKLNGSSWEFVAAAPVAQINDLLVVHQHGEQVLYAAGAIDFLPGSFPQFGHLAILAASVGLEDINQDRLIDLGDLSILIDCLSGPVFSYPSSCLNSTDIDSDFDVDLADFASLQRAWEP